MFPSAEDLAASGVRDAGHDAREVAESDGPSGTTEDKDLAGEAPNVGGLRRS